MNNYQPEGKLIFTAQNRNYIKSIPSLLEAQAKDIILEARATICDNEHNLIVDLPCIKGVIPRAEGAIGIDDGSTRDIALISRVNKPVCFKVLGLGNFNGEEVIFLSRKKAQEECIYSYISNLKNGQIIPARVTHLEQFGCFVDIACGIASLIPIDAISVSRIAHPSDRFFTGQDIYVIIKSIQNSRVFLSHKELLGTWEENISNFNVGETVSGIVRSVESYGIFIELAPNLAGLAEPRENVNVGQSASVFIKAIIPERMKVKLVIVDVFDSFYSPLSFDYYIKEGIISHWIYSVENADKHIETVF